jgi:RNA polymerase sigma-70 factor (ECF subfamily)
VGKISSQQDDRTLIHLTNHQPDLRAFVHSLMPGDPGVDDVVQQANLVVWRKRSAFKEGTNFLAWLFAIARLEVLAHRKKAGRKSWLVIDGDLTERLAETMASVSSEIPNPVLRGALDSCLKKLTPGEHSVIERYYFDGQSIKDMAESGGRSEGALKVSLHCIRTALRRCIQQHSRTSIGGTACARTIWKPASSNCWTEICRPTSGRSCGSC